VEPKRTEPKAETGGWKPTRVDISTSKRKQTSKPQQQQSRTELVQAARKASQQIKALAATPSIQISTPPGGGVAYANYAQMVKTIYERNWHPPGETSRDDAVVTVKIVIARDGTIRSSRIIGRSGDSGVDASVEATLRRVTKVRPFPDGATESTRTYTIGFNLKAKRALG
jgi:TonB family protein